MARSCKLGFPSSGITSRFKGQMQISEIAGLRMVSHSHPTPAVFQPSRWYPVRLATERCPLPIAPASSAGYGEAGEELPTAATQLVTVASIVAKVAGQLDIDLAFPAVGMALFAQAGRRAAPCSSSVPHSLESSRCYATAAVVGRQPHHSSTGSRGRTSEREERGTRNSSRSRSTPSILKHPHRRQWRFGDFTAREECQRILAPTRVATNYGRVCLVLTCAFTSVNDLVWNVEIDTSDTGEARSRAHGRQTRILAQVHPNLPGQILVYNKLRSITLPEI